MRWNIEDNLFDYLLYILILVLPFSQAIPNICLALLSILFLKDLTVQKIKAIRFSPVLIFAALVIYVSLKALILNTFMLDFPTYKGYILALWLLIILQKASDFKRLRIVVLISSNAMVFASSFLIGKFYLNYHFLPFTNTGEVNQLLFLERPYAGFFAVIGFFLSLELASFFPKRKWLLLANSVIMIAFIVLISARLSLVTIFLIGVVYFLLYFKTAVYKKTGTILLSSLVMGSILFYNKNMAQRFFIRENMQKSMELASNYEPRFVIWNCAYEMTKTPKFSFISGLESYTLITKNYRECYGTTISNSDKKDYFLTTNFNSHNQLIDYFLIGGLLAIMLLIAFFLNLFAIVRKHFFETALLIAIVFFFVVENVLYRQFGCYIFSIFATMLVMKKDTINDKI